LNTFVLSRPELGKFFGNMTARTTFELQQGVGASSASAYLGVPIIKGLRSETGLSWFRGSHGATFSLLIAAELPSVRSYTTVNAGGGQQAYGSQYVQGSAIYNPERSSIDFAAGPALQRGGVTDRIYLDQNNDGKFDGDDRPLPGVRVVVGQTYAVSDTN